MYLLNKFKLIEKKEEEKPDPTNNDKFDKFVIIDDTATIDEVKETEKLLEGFDRICSCLKIYTFKDRCLPSGKLLSGVAGSRLGHKSGANVEFSFDNIEIRAANTFIKNNAEYKQKEDSGEKTDIINQLHENEISNALNVAILDTYVDRDKLYSILQNKFNDIGFNVSVSNKRECTEGQSGTETNHGTVVAFQLIEKLKNNENKKDINIHIYSITNQDEFVTLPHVICALHAAKKDKNKYVNMSFGFDHCDKLLKKYVEQLADSAIFITAALGNNGVHTPEDSLCERNILSAFPAMYKHKKIIRVGAIQNDIRWANSNYTHISENFYVATPFINQNQSGGGGTSYASPRILADLITDQTFSSINISDNAGGSNILVLKEAN